MFFDSGYLPILLVTLALGGATQLYIKSTFSRWSQVPNSRGLTGAQVAQTILDANGIAARVGESTGEGRVGISAIAGHLTDHYDPRTGVVSLSDPVYGERTIAAAAVAAHEVGHAIQDAEDYAWGELRTRIVPVVNFGSSIAGVLIIFGIFTSLAGLIWLGVLGYATAVLFQVVTLPVELNASRRALVHLESNGLLEAGEVGGAKQVLTAAALTYVAGALIAILNLVYYIGLARRN